MIRPKSIAHWSDPFTTAIVAFAIYYCYRLSALSDTELTVVIVIGLTVFQCGLEVLRAPWRKLPRPDVSVRDALRSASVKWLGTMAGLSLVMLAWWLFQEYRLKTYVPLMASLEWGVPIMAAMVFIVGFYTEWRLGIAKHHGEDLGLVVLGRWKEVKWEDVRKDLFSWLIKGYFFAINYCELPKMFVALRGKEEGFFLLTWPQMLPVIVSIIYTFIIAAILPGYLFSSRLFGTHVRNIDQTWFGYVVTFGCYSPFVQGVFSRWFNFHQQGVSPAWNTPWVQTLGGYEVLLYICGGLIIFFEVFHYWGEAIFGIRSSNLSNRGIITNGPYVFTKHPVYAAKCFSWFLMWMPFIAGQDVFEDLRLTLCFVGVCIIFIMRGWAEEKMLSTDPAFVSYALWVDRHGVFSFAGKLLPVLQYEWRLRRWIKRGDIPAAMLPF